MKHINLTVSALLLAALLTACGGTAESVPEATPTDTEADTVITEAVTEAVTEAPKTPDLITENGEYALSFEDSFDGKYLNEKIWSICPEWTRQDIGCRWDEDMVSLDGEGHLILTNMLDDDGTPLSGGIRTRGKFEQAYGYFECRMKFQSTTGFWGAFWLMTDEIVNVGNGAVDGAEIDIIESGEVARGGVNHAIHWDGYGEEHQSVSQLLYDGNWYDGEYHTYAFEWTKDEYIFYIDGEVTWRTSEPGICTVPCYVKVTSEFGSWAAPIVPEELPDTIEVDYVKVYHIME